MSAIVDIFHARVRPEETTRLLQVRGKAINALRAQCPGLRRAELVRLDDGTWVDVLVWDDTAAAEEAVRHFASIPALAEMHEICGVPTAYERGTLEHSA